MASSVAEDARVSGAAKGPLGTGREWKEQGAMSTATATTTSEPAATNKRQAAEAAELRENTERAALRIAARKGKAVTPVPKPKDAAKGTKRARATDVVEIAADQLAGATSNEARAAIGAAALAALEQVNAQPDTTSEAPKAEAKERPSVLRVAGKLYRAESVEEKTALCKLASELLGKKFPGAGMASKALRDAGKAEWVEVDEAGKPKSEKKARGTAIPGVTPEMLAASREYHEIRKGGGNPREAMGERYALITAHTRVMAAARRARLGLPDPAPRGERKPKAAGAKQPSKADILALIMDVANDAMTVAELRAKLFPVIAQPESAGETSEQAEAESK